MNSADKIKDDGTLAPVGSFLGMDRTLLDTNGDTWLESEAFTDTTGPNAGTIPLDDEIGTGHLNALRALQQYAAGEHDPNGSDVPLIGWDYDDTDFAGDTNVYALDATLQAGTYFSATLAWDRRIYFLVDGGTQDQYDIGDDFADADLGNFNWMSLYLVPSGGTALDAVAMSVSQDDTIQHIFTEIPTRPATTCCGSSRGRRFFSTRSSLKARPWLGRAPAPASSFPATSMATASSTRPTSRSGRATSA